MFGKPRCQICGTKLTRNDGVYATNLRICRRCGEGAVFRGASAGLDKVREMRAAGFEPRLTADGLAYADLDGDYGRFKKAQQQKDDEA